MNSAVLASRFCKALTQSASFVRCLGTSECLLSKSKCGKKGGKGKKKPKRFRVCIAGASGGIGQPLCLLLKQCPMIKELHLYDIVHTPGVAADLADIETPAKVLGFNGEKCLDDALKGCEIVVIPAGVPRKPGMSRDDLFNTNAGIIRDISYGISRVAPKAMIVIITNPINATIPICAEVMKTCKAYDPCRIFGCSTLDSVRTSTFVAQLCKMNPMDVSAPVIGGHAGATIIPLISQCKPKVKISGEDLKKLIERIQNAGTVVVKAKAGAGSATLSMAYAAARFTISLMCGMRGEKNVIESAFVPSDVIPDLEFFATPLCLGPNGVEKNLGMGKLSELECKMVEAAIPLLKKSAEKGKEFARKKK